MEKLPKDRFLEYNENTLQEVRKTFDLDKPGVMEDVVNILEEWVKKQPHFTNTNFDRRYLETTIILCKGSIERAKSRIDRACTLRTLMPHLVQVHDSRHLQEITKDVLVHSMMPKMTINNERVFISRVIGNKFEDIMLTSMLQQLPCFSEYIRRNDYAETYYGVLDCVDADLIELAKTLTFSAVQETAAYLLECCGFRAKQLYVISSSKLVVTIIDMIKQVLSPKLRERLHVIKDRESLKDLLDKNVLPIEYGGHEQPLEVLNEKFAHAVVSKEHIEYLQQIFSARTDEDKRQNLKFNEEYMGMPGSFRKLHVD